MAVFDPAVFDGTVFEAEADPNMAASGSFVLAGVASLQLTVTFEAVGVLEMAGVAALTTDITMAAEGLLVLAGEAALQAAKSAARLSGCGHVLAADCDQWLLQPFL